jgi:hypothetical protein
MVVRKKRVKRLISFLNHAGIDFEENRQRNGLCLGEKLAKWALFTGVSNGDCSEYFLNTVIRRCIFVKIVRFIAIEMRNERIVRFPAIVSQAGQEMQSIPQYGDCRK